MGYPTNSDDVIDSRTIEDALSELEGMEIDVEADPRDYPEDVLYDEDDRDALVALRALKEEAEGYCEWNDGATLVRESYWVDYSRQTAEDTGMIDGDSAMYNYVDWDRWAADLKMDYTSVEFDGVTYYVR